MGTSTSSTSSGSGKSKRQLYIETWGELVNERQSWVDHWRDLAEFILPWRFRFLDSEGNKGARKDSKIINFAPRRAAGILAAGMMAGITSPARKWFRLATADPRLNAIPAVKSWLSLTEKMIFEIFLRSNLYACLYNVFLDLGTPGTAALYVEDDEEDIVRGYVFLAGSYALANSSRLAVDHVYRQFRMTVGQVVEKFGLERCSEGVRQLYENNQKNQWVRVLHCIEPNTDRDPRFVDDKNMPVRSVWMEMDRKDDSEIGFLRESGFAEFPAMCPRWAAAGEDVYGSDSPGMICIGEAKALQLLKKEKLKAVEKIVSPPMKAPTSMRNERISFISGDVTFGDSASTHDRLEPAQIIDTRAVGEIRAEEREATQAIDAAYFADLFLSISNLERSNTTAEEIRARQQEKMMQLGPVLERLNDELLDPLIDRVFGIALRRGVIPVPPKELDGANLKVEYISILGQAQKLLGTTAVERMVQFFAAVSRFDAAAIDSANWDRMVADYAEMLGLNPDALHTPEEIEAVRSARAKAQATEQQVQQALAATQGAKNLAGANLEDDNALSRMINANGPMAAAAANQIVGGAAE